MKNARCWAAEITVGGGDFSITNGAGAGRRIMVAAKNNATITANGTADHVALVDVAAQRLLYVTTCPPQLLGQGGSVNFDGWSVEIGAPL